jgi:hypothetical protein
MRKRDRSRQSTYAAIVNRTFKPATAIAAATLLRFVLSAATDQPKADKRRAE